MLIKHPVDKNLEKNLQQVKEVLGAEESFDVLVREFLIGGRDAALVYIDGFIKDELILPINRLMETKREEISVNALKKLLNTRLAYYEIETEKSLDKVVQQILAGPQVLFLDGIEEAVIIDGRSWMSRSPEEPELEKVTRGPADGFVETMVFNVTAVRRRVRDVNFRAEVLQVGKRSKNDVALVYMKDIINHDLLQNIKTKLESIDIDGIPLADKSVEEIITDGTLNPLPVVRYTERPDNVAAHILEGHLALIIDNSPTALILPAPFFSHIQTLEDYRKSPVVGTYLSLLRGIAIIISIFLPAVWYLLAADKVPVPEFLEFVGIKEGDPTINLGLQFILASLGIELIRMASIQTPDTLATSLSLVSALLLGEFAVEVGLFSSEIILYMAISAISNFAIPGYEMTMVLKMIRLIFLLAVITAGFWGLVVSFVAVFLMFAFTKSFGVYYLWPLIPFNYAALKSYIFRLSIFNLSNRRPDIYNLKDEDRTGEDDERN